LKTQEETGIPSSLFYCSLLENSLNIKSIKIHPTVINKADVRTNIPPHLITLFINALLRICRCNVN